MCRFIKRNARHIQYRCRAHSCNFDQDDRQEILNGFKSTIAMEEAMISSEFCDLMELAGGLHRS